MRSSSITELRQPDGARRLLEAPVLQACPRLHPQHWLNLMRELQAHLSSPKLLISNLGSGTQKSVLSIFSKLLYSDNNLRDSRTTCLTETARDIDFAIIISFVCISNIVEKVVSILMGCLNKLKKNLTTCHLTFWTPQALFQFCWLYRSGLYFLLRCSSVCPSCHEYWAQSMWLRIIYLIPSSLVKQSKIEWPQSSQVAAIRI